MRATPAVVVLLFAHISDTSFGFRPILSTIANRVRDFTNPGRIAAPCPFDASITVEELEREATDQQIDEAVDAFDGTRSGYIIRPYRPERWWLWKRFRGTILQNSLLITLVNMTVSLGVVVSLRAITARSGSIWAIGLKPDTSHPIIARLDVFDKVWHYQMTLTTFVLTFFVNEAYQFWRTIYDIGRGIQGRLNDINLLLATHADRDSDGNYTPEARDLLDDVGKHSRLFHVLLWASCSRRHRVLLTDRGLNRMVERNMLSKHEKKLLQNLDLPPTQRHNACLEWMIIRWRRGIDDDVIKGNNGLIQVLLDKACTLRGTFASISDKVDGRMPLSYAHFVQILVDSFLLTSPLALYSQLGAFSVLSVGLLTLFYSGFLDLAKIMLDPLNNEGYCRAVYMDLGVLVREGNAGSVRWRDGAAQVPSAIYATTRRL